MVLFVTQLIQLSVSILQPLVVVSGNAFEAIHGSEPSSSDGAGAVAITAVEDSEVTQLMPRRSGSHDCVVGDHRRIVSTVAGSSAVADV